LRTRQYIPEGSELHPRRRENLKSHKTHEDHIFDSSESVTKPRSADFMSYILHYLCERWNSLDERSAHRKAIPSQSSPQTADCNSLCSFPSSNALRGIQTHYYWAQAL
jgi:hypothetical protein